MWTTLLFIVPAITAMILPSPPIADLSTPEPSPLYLSPFPTIESDLFPDPTSTTESLELSITDPELNAMIMPSFSPLIPEPSFAVRVSDVQPVEMQVGVDDLVEHGAELGVEVVGPRERDEWLVQRQRVWAVGPHQREVL